MPDRSHLLLKQAEICARADAQLCFPLHVFGVVCISIVLSNKADVERFDLVKQGMYEHNFVSASTGGLYPVMYENVNTPKWK